MLQSARCANCPRNPDRHLAQEEESGPISSDQPGMTGGASGQDLSPVGEDLDSTAFSFPPPREEVTWPSTPRLQTRELTGSVPPPSFAINEGAVSSPDGPIIGLMLHTSTGVEPYEGTEDLLTPLLLSPHLERQFEWERPFVGGEPEPQEHSLLLPFEIASSGIHWLVSGERGF